MSFSATVYRVLVASPGDLVEERGVIVDAIYRWNATYAVEDRTVLLPVLWETHSVPELGDRPQAILNHRLLAGCDILVGVFWTRLGTPTGSFASGTLEEIEEFRRAGKPVLLYFSSRHIDPDRVDLEQLMKLRETKALFREKGVVHEFASPFELRETLTHHLYRQVRRLGSGDAFPEKQVSTSPPPPHTSALPAAERVINHEPPPADHAASGSLYHEYWKELGAALARSGSRLRQPTARAKNYVRFPAGGAGARIYAFASIRERYLGVELVLGPGRVDAFRALQAQSPIVESEVGQALEWIEHPKSYRIVARVHGHDPSERADWGRQHAWFIGTLEQFKRNLVARMGKGSGEAPVRRPNEDGPIFRLKLQQSYYQKGFFNVGVAYDQYVRKADGPIRLRLGRQGEEIEGILNRQANPNGTARIHGAPALTEWFQVNFEPMETVAVDLSSEDVIVLEKE
jgi:hypothetical protein